MVMYRTCRCYWWYRNCSFSLLSRCVQMSIVWLALRLSCLNGTAGLCLQILSQLHRPVNYTACVLLSEQVRKSSTGHCFQRQGACWGGSLVTAVPGLWPSNASQTGLSRLLLAWHTFLSERNLNKFTDIVLCSRPF